MDYTEIKNRITRVSKAQSITNKQMAADLGFTPQGYRGWFLEKTLRVKTVFDIAEYLNVDPRYILFGDVDQNLVSEDNPGYKPVYIEDRMASMEQRIEALEKKVANG